MKSPRAYQARMSDAIASRIGTVDQLGPDESTLGIAPTASGKSYLFALTAERFRAGRPIRALFVQHRDELVEQNEAELRTEFPAWVTSRFTADEKVFADPTTTAHAPAATFAMDASLEAHLDRGEALPAFDLLLLDECERAVSPRWKKILAAVRAANPALRVVGLTATPERGDGKSLAPAFASVADQISIAEVLAEGGLVPPRGFIVSDVAQLAPGLTSLQRTANGRGDYDENEVAALLGQAAVLERVIDLWAEHAAGPNGKPVKTIFFCSGVALAKDVAGRLRSRGYSPALITGAAKGGPGAARAKKGEGAKAVRRRAKKEADHYVNCMTLTAGFNDPAIRCVVLFKRCAFRGLVIQMIGRGMRPCPEIGKRDCLVIDAGLSLQSLGGLDAVFDLGSARAERPPGPPAMKPCANPKCRRAIRLRAKVCPLCHYVYPPPASQAPVEIDPASVQLKPFDVALRESDWRWIEGRAGARIAQSGEAVWALAFACAPGRWAAVGVAARVVELDDGQVVTDATPRVLVIGTREEAIAYADAHMSLHGKVNEHGRAAWGYHRVPATPKQLRLIAKLKLEGLSGKPSLYEANCRITARFARHAVLEALTRAATAGERIAA